MPDLQPEIPERVKQGLGRGAGLGVGLGNDEEQVDVAVRAELGATVAAEGEDGTGLGLAIVKRILRSHRGDIAVESTGSGGTTFRFWIPVAA